MDRDVGQWTIKQNRKECSRSENAISVDLWSDFGDRIKNVLVNDSV